MSTLINPTEKEYLFSVSQRSTKGSLIISQMNQTFAANTTLGVQTLSFTNAVVGSASVVSPTQNSPWVGLRTTTANGDKVTYQSRYYMGYWAYRTHQVSFAVSFDTTQENYVQRAGLFDDNDGFFFQYDTNGLHVVHRSATSGSPVDTVVSMSDFNIDNLKNGPSTLIANLDFHLARGMTMGITYNWYGTQGATFWIAYGNSVVQLHEFIFTGQISGLPYMRTPMLPLRFQAENTGAASAQKTMRVGTCSQSIGDAASIDLFYQFSASSGTTAKTVNSTTTWVDLIAVRPKTTLNSIPNRGLLEIAHWQLLAESNSIEYRIIDNVTYTGGSWTSANDQSIAEFATSPGTQAGTPRVIDVNYLYSGRTSGGESPENIAANNIRIGLDTLTGAQYCYVIQARKLSASDASVYSAVTWKEQY